MELRIGIFVDEHALLLTVAFVKDYKSATAANWGRREVEAGVVEGSGNSGPLAQVSSCIEVCHSRGMVVYCAPFGIPDDETPVFLVQISGKEEIE